VVHLVDVFYLHITTFLSRSRLFYVRPLKNDCIGAQKGHFIVKNQNID